MSIMCSEHTDSPVNRSGKGNVPRTAPYDFAGDSPETWLSGSHSGRTDPFCGHCWIPTVEAFNERLLYVDCELCGLHFEP